MYDYYLFFMVLLLWPRSQTSHERIAEGVSNHFEKYRG